MEILFIDWVSFASESNRGQYVFFFFGFRTCQMDLLLNTVAEFFVLICQLVYRPNKVFDIFISFNMNAM